MARVGVMGATGLVGSEMLRILEEHNVLVDELRVYTSERSAGKQLSFAGDAVTCQVLTPHCFDGLDLVIVDVDDPIALEWAPIAVASGARVIDNSAAFRMDPDVPLVVAEVNPGDLAEMRRGIVSCPNCTTMVMLTALAPLHAEAQLTRLVVSTYQSVSGAGQAGIAELDAQWRAGVGQIERYSHAGTIDGAVAGGDVWDRAIAGNVIPLAGSRNNAGYTSEEWKLVYETRKILHEPELGVTATCVRVPVFVGHALSINATFAHPLTAADACALLADAPGVELIANGDGAPTPMEAAGGDPVLVGRVREDQSLPGALNLWVTGDNLRKGAALNAVQLAELLA
ncbi:MAG: aspartate-semialdehyde dehydrogenase [Acidimicrobiia bacterium]